uniref:Uncharacterized protein n=1 Tax=Macrostomum lignano TaxID=282301 RepID=A0A1I8HBM9_9PLAT
MEHQSLGELALLSLSNSSSLIRHQFLLGISADVCDKLVVALNGINECCTRQWLFDRICEAVAEIGPFLTPVESAISAWKAAIKSELSDSREVFINPSDEARAGRTLAEYRRDELMRFADLTVNDSVTQDKCIQWYNHCFSFVPRCLARMHINGD